MIEGQFLTIDEGDRLERTVIGLGVGATVVHTQVQVYDELPAGRRLVEEFKTTAKSAIKPGIAETLPVGAAVSGIGQATVLSTGIGAATEIPASVKADAKRTATEIIKHLQPFFVCHGWIAPR